MNLRYITISAAIISIAASVSCGRAAESEPITIDIPAVTSDAADVTTSADDNKPVTTSASTAASGTTAAAQEHTTTAAAAAVTAAPETTDAPQQELPEQEAEQHSDEPEKEPETEAPAETPASTLSFSADDIMSDITSLTAQLGSPDEKFKAAACTRNGSDIYVYKYSGLEVQSFIDDSGRDSVCSIMITSDSYSTREGLKVGDPQGNVTSCYGSGEAEGDKIYYTFGSKELEVGISGGSVSYINFYCPV